MAATKLAQLIKHPFTVTASVAIVTISVWWGLLAEQQMQVQRLIEKSQPTYETKSLLVSSRAFWRLQTWRDDGRMKVGRRRKNGKQRPN